ncbi:MAG TPA: hypothetical protein PLB81_07445 [Deltaproteobacteria bacterium]|nr:hypothetical protein [Deltaproteobacteria bacterium]
MLAVRGHAEEITRLAYHMAECPDLLKIKEDLGEQAQAMGFLRETLFGFFDNAGEIMEIEQGILGVLVSLKNSLEYASERPDLKYIHFDILEQALAVPFVGKALLRVLEGGEIDEVIDGVLGALVALGHSLAHTSHRLEVLALGD